MAKDNGNGRVCFVNNGAAAGFASFDPTKLDFTTASVNGVPVSVKGGKPQCFIQDCNGDGIPDVQCTFATCFAPVPGGPAEPTAAPPLAAELGELTMTASFKSNTGDISGLICTADVATSGNP